MLEDEDTLVCTVCGSADPCEHDEDDDEECRPVPPVPAGYPTDRAMIYKEYGQTFVSIDRRNGELAICTTGVGLDEENVVILSPARAMALYRFFWNDDMIELMEYHRKNATEPAPLGRAA